MAQAPYYNLDVITPNISSSPYLLYGSPHPALVGFVGAAGAPGGVGGGGGLFPPVRGADARSLLPVNVQSPRGGHHGSPAPSSGSSGVPFSGYGAPPEMNNGGWRAPPPPPRSPRGAVGGGAPNGDNNNNGWMRVGQYQNNWGSPDQRGARNNDGARPSVADMPAAGIRQGAGPPRRYDLISGSGPGAGGYGAPGRVSPADLPAAGGRRQQREVYDIVTNQGGNANENGGGGGRAGGGRGGVGGGGDGGGGYGNFYSQAQAAGGHPRANRRYTNYLLNGYEEPVDGVRNIASSAVKYDIISGAPLR